MRQHWGDGGFAFALGRSGGNYWRLATPLNEGHVQILCLSAHPVLVVFGWKCIGLRKVAGAPDSGVCVGGGRLLEGEKEEGSTSASLLLDPPLYSRPLTDALGSQNASLSF